MMSTPVTLAEIEQLAKTMWRGEVLPGRVLRFGAAVLGLADAAAAKPIDMILYCPACGTQHLDAPTPCTAEMCEGGCVQPEECNAWRNPTHRSHLCASCSHIWRPADVPTNGVSAIVTRGRDDSAAVVLQIVAENESTALRLTDFEAVAFKNLEKLCGYWQDGSDEVVRIFQDDALRCYGVEIGKITFTGPTLAEALRLAAASR